MSRPRLRLLLLAPFLGLAGCYGDPFQNPGNWSMTAAPAENTAQQVADKSELLQGRGGATSNGVAAAAAVDVTLGGVKGDAAGLQKPPPSITSFSSTGGGGGGGGSGS